MRIDSESCARYLTPPHTLSFSMRNARMESESGLVRDLRFQSFKFQYENVRMDSEN